VKIILEVKGFETEQDRQKEAAARRWVRAVNHHGEFGRWAFAVCKDPPRLRAALAKAADGVCGVRRGGSPPAGVEDIFRAPPEAHH
jgi:hypothetical protein